MTNKNHENKHSGSDGFEQFIAGIDPISKAIDTELQSDEPSPALDRAILAKARQVAIKKTNVRAHPATPSNSVSKGKKQLMHFPWLPAAASIVLALLFFQYGEQADPSLKSTDFVAPSQPEPAPVSEQASAAALVKNKEQQATIEAKAKKKPAKQQSRSQKAKIKHIGSTAQPTEGAVEQAKNNHIQADDVKLTGKTTNRAYNDTQQGGTGLTDKIIKAEESQKTRHQLTKHEPEGISLAALSLKNRQKMNKPIASSKKNRSKSTLEQTKLKIKADKKSTEQEQASAPALLASAANEIPASTSPQDKEKQALTQDDPLHYQCNKASYLAYYQQQQSAQKWLRDHLIEKEPKWAKQAHYDHNTAKQQLDDASTLIFALFELAPKQVQIQKDHGHWLPKINEQLRRQLCRHSDNTCQAAIRYSVPTRSLSNTQTIEKSSYQLEVHRLINSAAYQRLQTTRTKQCL